MTRNHQPATGRALTRRAGRRARPGRVALYTGLALASALWLFPMVWALFSSFKRRSDIFAYPPSLLPPDPTLDNYATLFERHPFWQWFLISTLIALTSTAITVVVCSMAGYGFAKYRFRFKKLLFNVMFSSLAIPFAVIVVPLFVFLARTGAADPWFALVVPWVAPAFGIFMMRQFVEQSVPDEILDAGRIDGVGEAGLFWRLVMPLLRPAIAALAVWSFLNSYNNFLWPLIVIGDPDSYTLPLGLQAIFGAEGRQYDIVLAGSMLAAIPSVLVFVALRKQLIDGLSAGALKG
ncbi:carbohydrate ABC transporter permease [Streptomyces sp. DSM 44915]|uniref:Carbohydrate ABC transporter permease n=1 Tax=Streptomyces chisholmiae TaxID=3075540 RepID=A0ABU2JVA9_9ACTN|nr:carbohydrate ABC transporter permease [Streptomyces sp. DSM 44915]MDT0268693.1 carbohydrate ABC transporter permease [Streptomyces sp. DSM 44915]